ncbi:hypothetical protein GNI_205440, partial [Gregarina niphandrodes]
MLMTYSRGRRINTGAWEALKFEVTTMVDGTACLGKSTLLQGLKDEGYAVVVGDYCED